EFAIRETEDNPFLYTNLLRFLGIDGKDINELKALGAQQNAHPMGGEATNHFFRSMVQRLWPDGEYFESEMDIANPGGAYIYRQPMMYLGSSNQGFAEALERYVDSLREATELPESLVRIAGIETGRAAEGRAEERDVDILLTKDANPEQELVIHRLEETGAVLVQGPPGTGKSHTIANLIGHLLAQGKSILVTSHTSKALRIVRQHVAAPLRSLCVSVFHDEQESTQQLEESITGIVNYVSTTSKRKLQREIDHLKEKREELKAEHKKLNETLLGAMTDEYRDLTICGEEIPPSLAARRLVEFKGLHDWIPGPVTVDAELPLDPAEIQELYDLTEKVTANDEGMLTSTLPDPEKLPEPKEFASLFDDINRLERMKLKHGTEFWRHENQTLETLAELVSAITAAGELLAGADEWLLECVDAGRNVKGEAESWQGLVKLIEDCCHEIPPKEELILAHGPKVKGDQDPNDQIRVCKEIIDHLKAGKKLKRFNTMLKPEWQQFIETCQIDEGAPTKLAHFQALLNYLEVKTARENLRRRWDRQLGALDAPKSTELGRKPEKTAKLFAEKILAALRWHDEEWARCQTCFDEAGLDWRRLSSKAPVKQSSHGAILQIRDILLEHIKPVIETRKDFLRWQHMCRMRDEWYAYLDTFSKKQKSYELVKLFRHGIKKPAYDDYLQAWTRLQELVTLRDDFERRNELVTKIEP
ncbi:MAG: AAA domain-containing protein, partial [Planctomycetota bacterium]